MSTTTIDQPTLAGYTQLFRAQQLHAPAVALATARERIEKIERIEKYLKDPAHQAALVQVMQADFGKPELETVVSETGVLFQNITYIKRRLRRWMRPQAVNTPLPLLGTSSYVHHEPKGVCLVIGPWNYPFMLATLPVVYAIAAGNTVVLKPSELATNCSAYLRAMFAELFDEREVAVCEGGVETATALLELPFNHIFFTGSPQVGKIVMAAAAKHLTSVTLELGGKSPAIIDETVNVPAVARRTAWAKCFNAGQTCVAPDYLVVHESVQQAFAEAYATSITEFFGPRVQASDSLARIINPRNFDRLKALLDDAIGQGAQVLAGGETDAHSRFVAPTLLGQMTPQMRIMQEEIFGPLLPMLTYRHMEEIPALVNALPKPLTFYINSHNRKLTDYLLQHTSAGGTIVNDYLLSFGNPNLPFGGVNNSGIGRSLGFRGFQEFSNERGVVRRWLGDMRVLFPPYTAARTKLVDYFLKKL